MSSSPPSRRFPTGPCGGRGGCWPRVDAEVEVLDEDRDAGGVRKLLRVPPTMTTCHQAIAWTAGFDDPSLYRPMVEA